MNYNKVNVITNELSNTKEYIPIGDVYLTKDIKIKDLYPKITSLENEIKNANLALTTYKESVKQAFSALQSKFDTISSALDTENKALKAEINNIKESIKLLGGVL